MNGHPGRKRLLGLYERYLQNPPIRLLLKLGLPLPFISLLETTGRASGRPRCTPVMNGLVAGHFWIVAEHGRQSQYVRNLVADPRVRIRIDRRWIAGTAHVLDADDPWNRARWLAREKRRPARLDELAARLFGSEPVTVRIDLDARHAAR